MKRKLKKTFSVNLNKVAPDMVADLAESMKTPLKLYKVGVTRTSYSYQSVEVSAKNKKDALDKAIKVSNPNAFHCYESEYTSDII
jgi:hypothetical protein